ncbi:MAG: hypothetical protein JWQ66_1792 [Mucilaginibacter sp.]|nr:hypothetical protein [Mucilaginibacter sp.]
MKKTFCCILAISLTSSIFGQGKSPSLRIELAKSDKVVIYSDAVFVEAEGYDGDAVLVSPQKTSGEKVLPMAILSDNTDSKDSVITYQSKLSTGANNFVFNNIKIITNCKSIKILVPNSIPLLALEFKTTSSDGLIKVKNYKGPIQVASYFGRLEIEGLSGPFYISDEYGKISLKNILWTDTARWTLYDHPYAVRSASSDIDIAVPAGLKAYFTVMKDKGKVYSKLNLASGMVLNGGGIGISVKSTAGNIFLRHDNDK